SCTARTAGARCRCGVCHVQWAQPVAGPQRGGDRPSVAVAAAQTLGGAARSGLGTAGLPECRLELKVCAEARAVSCAGRVQWSAGRGAGSRRREARPARAVVTDCRGLCALGSRKRAGDFRWEVNSQATHGGGLVTSGDRVLRHESDRSLISWLAALAGSLWSQHEARVGIRGARSTARAFAARLLICAALFPRALWWGVGLWAPLHPLTAVLAA